MRGYMFRNRWFALLFVGLVLAGVTRLVGTSDDKGALDAAASQIAAQREAAEELTGNRPASDADDVTFEFTADEELIDPAIGEDPTPIDQRATNPEAAPEEAHPHDTVILVSQGEAGLPPEEAEAQ